MREDVPSCFKKPIKGAVALKISVQLLFCKKKYKKTTARPRKNLAVSVKLMYDKTHYLTKKL